MGLTFSTKNYNNIINIAFRHTVDPFDITTGPGIQVWAQEEQDKRHLVYKHQTKNIFLLYIGNVSSIAKCLEVNERFLERYARHFDNFSTMKQYIIKNYPGDELVTEVIKYESTQEEFISASRLYLPNNVLSAEKEYLFTDSYETSDSSDTSDSFSDDSTESTRSTYVQKYSKLNIKPFDSTIENFSNIEDTFATNRTFTNITFDAIDFDAYNTSHLYNYPFHNKNIFDKCTSNISFEPFMSIPDKIPTLNVSAINNLYADIEKYAHSQTSLGTSPIKPSIPQIDSPVLQLTPSPILQTPPPPPRLPSSPMAWSPTSPFTAPSSPMTWSPTLPPTPPSSPTMCPPTPPPRLPSSRTIWSPTLPPTPPISPTTWSPTSPSTPPISPIERPTSPLTLNTIGSFVHFIVPNLKYFTSLKDTKIN